MANNIIERILSDLLKATTDNTKFLASISRSIQQDQGEKTPQRVGLYTHIGSLQNFEPYTVPHPSNYVDSVTFQLSEMSSSGSHVIVSTNRDLTYDEVNNFIGNQSNVNQISGFFVLDPDRVVTIKTNQVLYCYDFNTSPGTTETITLSMAVTYYETEPRHISQKRVEEITSHLVGHINPLDG